MAGQPDPKPKRDERSGRFVRTGRSLVCAASDCEREFYRRPSRIGPTSAYCSRECWRKNAGGRTPEGDERVRVAMKRRKGAANPNYRHGRRVGEHEQELARLFNLGRKGERACRNCGSTEHLQLHHVVPRSLCRAARLDLRNGLPLCLNCHMGWHRRLVTIYRDVFLREEWEYVSSLRLTGREIAAWLDDRYPSRPPDAERGPRCAGCGCRYDVLNFGCATCRSRHAARPRNYDLKSRTKEAP